MVDKNEKIGIIGLGKMGRCLVEGLLRGGCEKRDILFTTKHTESAENVETDLGITRCKANLDLVSHSSVIVLAVKPQSVFEVLEEVGQKFNPSQTLISIAASLSTQQIEGLIQKNIPVLRAMPNTPAFVGEAITAVCFGKWAKASDWKRAEKIFSSVGKVIRVDEKHMDAVTGLSGCGPAYVYVILESLTEGGIKVGLPREMATQLASQTVMGSAKMLLQTGRHPAALKDEVTTPAGCTIDGLMELEEGKLRVTLIKAVVQATKRAKRLAKLSKV